MDHSEEIPVSQEAPTTGIYTDLAPVVPSVSENPMIGELVLNRALEVESRAEEYGSRVHMLINEYGYIPLMPMDTRFLPPRSVPPDIGQRNPWSISTQLSSNRQIITPDVVHHPSPTVPHASPVSMINPHPFATGNQFTHLSPPPPPPIHGGPPNYQVPGMGMANPIQQPYPYNQPYPYMGMPPLPMQPPNPIRSLPTLTHIPLLSGHLDFAPWDSGVRSILRSLGLVGHITVTGDPIDPLRPETLPSYPPNLAQGYGQADLMAYRQWWDRDAIADHVVTTRLSNLVRASIPPDNILGTRTALTVYEAIRQLYGLRGFADGLTIYNSD